MGQVITRATRQWSSLSAVTAEETHPSGSIPNLPSSLDRWRRVSLRRVPDMGSKKKSKPSRSKKKARTSADQVLALDYVRAWAQPAPPPPEPSAADADADDFLPAPVARSGGDVLFELHFPLKTQRRVPLPFRARRARPPQRGK